MAPCGARLRISESSRRGRSRRVSSARYTRPAFPNPKRSVRPSRPPSTHGEGALQPATPPFRKLAPKVCRHAGTQHRACKK